MQLTKYTKYKPLKKYDKAWDLLLSDVPDSDSEVNSKHVMLGSIQYILVIILFTYG